MLRYSCDEKLSRISALCDQCFSQKNDFTVFCDFAGFFCYFNLPQPQNLILTLSAKHSFGVPDLFYSMKIFVPPQFPSQICILGFPLNFWL